MPAGKHLTLHTFCKKLDQDKNKMLQHNPQYFTGRPDNPAHHQNNVTLHSKFFLGFVIMPLDSFELVAFQVCTNWFFEWVTWSRETRNKGNQISTFSCIVLAHQRWMVRSTIPMKVSRLSHNLPEISITGYNWDTCHRVTFPHLWKRFRMQKLAVKYSACNKSA